MADALEYTEEHFDWVYMLLGRRLGRACPSVSHKPPNWREAWAHIVNQGPVSEALRVLETAIQYPDPNASVQAARSVVDLHSIFPDEVRICGPLLSSLRTIAERADKSAVAIRKFLDRLNTVHNVR